ncbi:MAG: VOC family protein [Pyrinomonadaceae bacterium]|nr:VOC family protein [Pyrinomonadaceae bacterium]
MNEPNKHKTIDYIEFPAKNIVATKRFYGDVFGWKFTDYGEDYVSFNDGKTTGGFDESDETAKHPLVVIYVENLKEFETKIKSAGGEITKDIFEFPGGFRFHFADVNGNELAVWSEKA